MRCCSGFIVSASRVLSFQPAATLRAGQGLPVCIQGRNLRNTRAKGRSQTPARPHPTARSAGGAGSFAKVKQQALGDRFARRLPCFWLPLFRGACYSDATADRVTLPSLPWLCDSSTPTLQVAEEEILLDLSKLLSTNEPLTTLTEIPRGHDSAHAVAVL